MKFVITIEDGTDGAVFMVSEPSLHERTVHAGTTNQVPESAAEVYAIVAWCALAEAARRDAEDSGGQCHRGTLQ